MIIISHRGYWKTPKQKNSLEAFKRSLISGFGVETDVRDYQGQIVISHGIADKNCVNIEDLFQMYRNINCDLPLALNIKANGLQQKLKGLLEKYRVTNYFVFDMSIPDGLVYLKNNLHIFARQSEFEKELPFYEKAEGVWMDSFNKDWMNNGDIQHHLNEGKQVCLVSPELHKRQYLLFWQRLSNMMIINEPRLMICTDYPEQAMEFFHGKN